MKSATLLFLGLFSLILSSDHADAASVRQIALMKNPQVQQVWNVWKTKIEPQKYTHTYSRGFQIQSKAANEDWLNVIKQIHYSDKNGCSDVHVQYVRKYSGYYRDVVQHIFGRARIPFDASYELFIDVLTAAVSPEKMGIATGYFTIHSIDADYDYIAIVDTLNNQVLMVYAGYSELAYTFKQTFKK